MKQLETGEGPLARAMVGQIIARNELGVLWSRTLMVAAKRAEILGDLLWPIATQEPFLTSLDTRKDAIDFIAARYAFETSEARVDFERVATTFEFADANRPEAVRQDLLKDAVLLHRRPKSCDRHSPRVSS